MAQEMGFFDENRSSDLAALLSEDVQVTASAVTGNLAKLYRYLNSSVGAWPTTPATPNPPASSAQPLSAVASSHRARHGDSRTH
jgi:hypothetical protein